MCVCVGLTGRDFSPKVLMSDMAHQFANAAEIAFGAARTKIRWCSYHVAKAFRKHVVGAMVRPYWY